MSHEHITKWEIVNYLTMLILLIIIVIIFMNGGFVRTQTIVVETCGGEYVRNFSIEGQDKFDEYMKGELFELDYASENR